MNSVLITGANRSIGLETAKQLSKKGFFVYLGSRTIAKGEAVVANLKENGLENIKAIEIDVTNLDSILAAKNTIEKDISCPYYFRIRGVKVTLYLRSKGLRVKVKKIRSTNSTFCVTNC